MVSANHRACVTGIGACTAVGLSAPATAAAVRAGIAGMQEHPFMINQNGEPSILATVPSIDPALTGVDRFLALMSPALEEALWPLVEAGSARSKITVIVGLPEQRPGVPGQLADEIASRARTIVSERCEVPDVRTAYKGHAGGLIAVRSAQKLLAEGQCEFCLVGGVDTYVDPDALDWIEENEQLHMPTNAWGFIPGEAASFLLLCTAATAEKYHLSASAQLLSTHYAIEKNRIKTETVCIGEGLTEAVGGAVRVLPESLRVSRTYCDQNGEAYRADEYGFMLARLAEYFVDPSDYVAPADCWGDVGAASGTLFVNQLCAAAEKNYSPGPVSLLWASSEGGDRAAALFYAESE